MKTNNQKPVWRRWTSIVGFILLVLAIFQSIRLVKNEKAVIGNVRAIVSAQISFRAARVMDSNKDGKGEFAATLSQLESFLSGKHERLLSSGIKDGYRFQLSASDERNSFSVHAKPLVKGITGFRKHVFPDIR